MCPPPVPHKTNPKLNYTPNTKAPWSEARGPKIGGPGSAPFGLTVATGHSNTLPLGHGPQPEQNHPAPIEPRQRYRRDEGGYLLSVARGTWFPDHGPGKDGPGTSGEI